MNEDDIRKFRQEFDDEQEEASVDGVDGIQNFTLMEEVSPLATCFETIASSTTPEPTEEGLQNQLCPNSNPYGNVSVITSASADIPNQDNLITDDDRPPPIDLLPNTVNEAYLLDDVREVPPDFLALLVGDLISMNQHQEAIRRCEEILNQMCLKTETDDYSISQVFNILATVYIDLKDYDEALGVLNNVLLIRQSKYGYGHLCVASVLNNMAVIHGKTGNYSDAYALCSQSLHIKLKYLHPSHMEVGKQFDNLGALDLFQGRYVAAARYYQEALYIYESRLGPDNPRTLRIKAKIGYCNGMIRDQSTISEEMTRKRKKRRGQAQSADLLHALTHYMKWGKKITTDWRSLVHHYVAATRGQFKKYTHPSLYVVSLYVVSLRFT